jgi:hypothetical protein
MNRLYVLSKLGLFFGLAAFLISLGGCVKDNKDIVPYVYLNLSLGLLTDLAHLGNHQTATLTPNEDGIGVIRYSNPQYPEIVLGLGQILNGKGLIIYRGDGYNYEVYDITCTFQAQTDPCALERNPDYEGIFDCPCCNSSFIYDFDGFSAWREPAALPLKRYSAYIEANSLIIRN